MKRGNFLLIGLSGVKSILVDLVHLVSLVCLGVLGILDFRYLNQNGVISPTLKLRRTQYFFVSFLCYCI